MKQAIESNNTQQSAVQEIVQDEATPSTWVVSEKAPDDVKGFIDAFYQDGFVFLNGCFLSYSNGYWKKLHTHAEVIQNIGKYFGAGARQKDIREVFNMLKVFCIVKSENFSPAQGHICFLNGTLDLDTYQLVPHNPHFHLQSGRDVKWDENAKAPTFEKYLIDVFRDDIDRDEKIQFILEWMGLCLIPDTRFEKFVVCVGEGGNGKSVLLKLMPELLGHENVYSAAIQRLGNRRALAELDGKLLLTSSEINENTVMDDGILKQIVSGDTVEGERKYDHPFTFTPCARIMLATNHLPKLRDVTHAFFRRLVMLRFNRNFKAEEMDMNLPAKLKTELAGIFAMAVSGLQALRNRGSFIVPKSSEDAASQYREDSDFFKLFADETLLRAGGEHEGMRPVAVYKLYSSWCQAHGIKKETNISLGKYLRRLGFDKTRSNGKDYWCVKMSQAGEEIASKRFAKVEALKPDNQPEPSSAVGTVKPVATQVGQTVPVEELAA